MRYVLHNSDDYRFVADPATVPQRFTVNLDSAFLYADEAAAYEDRFILNIPMFSLYKVGLVLQERL